MTAALSPHAKLPISMPSALLERGQAVAVGLSVLLHIGAFGLLLGWQPDAPPAAQPMSVEARLIALPIVADVAPTPPAAPPPAAVESPSPHAPVLDAELAQHRIERDEQQRQQQRIEQQRKKREQQEQQQRELAKQQREQAEQRALADAQVARQARLAADRAATAQAAAEAASRRYEPIEKIAPGYPARAMERRLEGDCTVRYTVSASGRVENPEVVRDCHPLFVVPSLAAAKRFRYQPRIVDGRAVAVPGVTNTFHYRIQPQR